jgi:O-antigen/teichoic acid export membrane protein
LHTTRAGDGFEQAQQREEQKLMIRLLRKILKNELVIFTLIKYFVHFLNFVRVILAAKILGPFFFGIWGFLNLAIQYLSHTLLGVQYSVNLELSTDHRHDAERNNKIISSALFLATVISTVLIAAGIGIYVVDNTLFAQYAFQRYSILVVGVVSLLHFQQLFFNIYRVYGKLYRIAFAELLISGSILVTLFFAQGNELISYLFAAWIGSLLVSTLFFVIRSPIPLSIRRHASEAVHLLKIGFPLLVYNLSYYLIIIVSTTVLSQFYSVETMGYYTLATNISNAILLGINSIVWAFFPKFLSQLKEGTPVEEVKAVIYKINRLYLAAIFVIFITFLLFSPILYMYLTRFSLAETPLNLLFVTQIILASNFAANTFTMARKNYLHLASLSLVSVVVVAVSALIFAYMALDYYWIAFSSVLGAIAFSITTRMNLKRLVPGIQAPVLQVTGVRVGLVIIVAGNLFFNYYVFYFNMAGIVVYLFSNWKNIRALYQVINGKWGTT